ncbi:uncharacterized protein LOC108986508 [Juglans regia]|uniref:Uncharacterized protein LOC108986508 n=1 Tax=Juglans regia TaxID=51240 RepID=A0A6P9EMJ7_JUGRE|nr:uncharacterized protein LOC108986508 [Juglans regia]
MTQALSNIGWEQISLSLLHPSASRARKRRKLFQPSSCDYNPLLSHSISPPISSQTSIFPSSQEENSKPRDSCALCFPKPNLPSSSPFSHFWEGLTKGMDEEAMELGTTEEGGADA